MTKVPLSGTRGFHEATTDIAQIDEWWDENPDANIGFTPHSMGWGIIDLDGEAGKDEWFKLGLSHDTPDTKIVTTPRGGEHLYFIGELPTTQWAPERKRCVGEHIDTRGKGSYALLPPSVTEHGTYTLANELEPVPVPEWITKKLADAAPVKRSAGAALDLPINIKRVRHLLQMYVKRGHIAVAGEGGQNLTYNVACEVLDAGLSPDAAIEALAEAWNEKCDPPWQRDELQTIVANAARYQQNEPGAKAHQPGQTVFADVALKLPLDIIFRRASEIEPLAVEWLWHHRIPLGMCSLIAGHGDVGKTTVLLDLAARVTAGQPWPDTAKTAGPASVLYLSGEDSPEHVLVPRFMAAGGKRDKLIIVDGVRDEETGRRTFNLKDDLERLGLLMRRLGDVRMVILDPISSYFGSTDTWRNTEVRGVLEPAVRWAAEHRIALIGNTHLSKGRGGTANARLLDSVAISALARSIYMVGEDPEEAKARIFVRSKGNIGPPIDGLRFRFSTKFVKEGLVAPFAEWTDDSVKITANELVSASDGAKKQSAGDRDREDAARFLTETLEDGPQPANKVMAAALAEGFKEPVLAKARRELGLRVSTENGVTMFALPVATESW